MHSSTLLTLLLALGATETLGSHIRRHPKLDIAKLRREASAPSEEPLVLGRSLSGGKKGKRLVRKKRAVCVPSSNSTLSLTSTSSTSTSSSTVAVTSTTAIGQGEAAQPPPTTSATPTTSSTHQATTSSTSTTSSASSTPTSASGWYLTDTWAGNTFFNNFNFWSWADPTHGTVDYLDAGDAWNSGLISINSQGQAMMYVDTTPQVQNARKSIRIHGNKVWTGGLVLMDASHMPEGCGTWPAWWQNGPNWPYGGEIDILEGVNDFTQNQVSLHTGPGCTMPGNLNNNMVGQLTTGNYNSYDCSSYDTANQGCGVRDMSNDNSYGAAFNSIGGGVYAMEWTMAGITVWWFPRNAIPSDITNNIPNPSSWPTPIANFPGSQCNPYQFFYDHYNIFDTTLCGDWAGADAVWNYAGYAGQSQSCAALTGYSTCSDYVLNQGSAFTNAYWAVNYVKYFNSTSV